MTIDLRIQFLGLCMYVPEDTSQMHVLLPCFPPRGSGGPPDESEGSDHGGGGQSHNHGAGSADPPQDAGAGAGHAHPVHYPRVMFDLAYKQPNQRGLSRDYQIEKLENCVLDLSGLTSAESIDVNLTPELPSLEGVAAPIHPDLVRKPPTPTGPLAARVTFGSGALTGCALGATFSMEPGGAPARMTYETEWTVRGIKPAQDEEGRPCLPPLKLKGSTSTLDLPRFYPIGQTVELTVFNAMEEVFPPEGELYCRPDLTDEPAEHFDAYPTLSRALHPPRKPYGRPPLDIHAHGKPGPQQQQSAECLRKQDRIPGVICIQAQSRLGTSETAG